MEGFVELLVGTREGGNLSEKEEKGDEGCLADEGGHHVGGGHLPGVEVTSYSFDEEPGIADILLCEERGVFVRKDLELRLGTSQYFSSRGP
jgi:hypothetical protein